MVQGVFGSPLIGKRGIEWPVKEQQGPSMFIIVFTLTNAIVL